MRSLLEKFAAVTVIVVCGYLSVTEVVRAMLGLYGQRGTVIIADTIVYVALICIAVSLFSHGAERTWRGILRNSETSGGQLAIAGFAALVSWNYFTIHDAPTGSAQWWLDIAMALSLASLAAALIGASGRER